MCYLENKQNFNIIEEITRNDGSVYREIGNLLHNGQAEYAVSQQMINNVRILKINIPHSNKVKKYEDFINNRYTFINNVEISEWIEWDKSKEIDDLIKQILDENKIN